MVTIRVISFSVSMMTAIQQHGMLYPGYIATVKGRYMVA
jgi:hypothetical protein